MPRPTAYGAVLAVATFLHWGPADTRQAPLVFPHSLVYEGTLRGSDYERLFEQPFSVPSGTRRIELQVTSTGRERRTVLDVGLRGPGGFRGWSGGRVETVSVSALTAPPGYLPGPIEPGDWAVIVGVPNIRPDGDDRYAIRITLHDSDRDAKGAVIRGGPAWYAGDLHAHSAHSDGRVRVGSPRAVGAPPHLVFDAARDAGLDFVSLSDHNTVAHWLDVDRLQPYYDSLLLLHGREVTTYRGHANATGERAFHDFRLAAPSESPARLFGAIGPGTFVSINHPARPDDESCMGCGWNVDDDEMLKNVHGVEVVNGATRSGGQAGWPRWAAWLNRGARLTAVGGSDEHTPDETEDNRLGRPTTVVWARELSESGIVQGLLSGRVYVRTRGPEGPALEFESSLAGRTFQMGEVVQVEGGRPADLLLKAHVGGAVGQSLRWIRNGTVVAADRIAEDPAVLQRTMPAAAGDWVSLVIVERDDPTLISNAIYVR